MTELGVGTTLRAEAWMHLDDPAMTVDDAVAELGRLGNTIVAVDRPGRRVKVLDTVVQIYPRTVM